MPSSFGQRVLENESTVWQENAWDNVEFTKEELMAAQAKIEKQGITENNQATDLASCKCLLFIYY